MADYAIGDVHGCFDALLRLLKLCQFDVKTDRLFFAGDLVNRGPHSLEVLRFVKALGQRAIVTLGNHDLHLLYKLFIDGSKHFSGDTLEAVLLAEDRYELGHWLRTQPLLCYEESLNCLICHAGIAPFWDLSTAKSLANELETVLAGDAFSSYLTHMFGHEPNYWSPTLEGFSRLRSITNFFTRMRFCDKEGHLFFQKDSPLLVDNSAFPWYACPSRKPIDADIIFGHWAALQGNCPLPGFYAIDTGCVWGGQLTALRLQDKKRFSVPA